MKLDLAAKPGLCIDMSQTKSQEQGAAQAKPVARKDWEWFWRIVAGLMVLVIAWLAWVLYQITPRSLVTPLAYSSQVRPVVTQQPAAAAPAPPAGAPVSQPAAVAVPATDPAQAAAPADARPSSAAVQAESQDKRQEQPKVEGLRLATEISMPPAEKQRTPKTR